MIVSAPVTSQATSSQPGEPTSARDVGRHDEDARADHRAGHEHRRVEQTESANELLLVRRRRTLTPCLSFGIVPSRARIRPGPAPNTG